MNNWDERQQESWGGTISPQTCPFADLLASWAGPVVSDAEQKQDLMIILQAKLLLLDKFFSIRACAPKVHRFKMVDTGHVCIWNRFEEFYNRLRIAEMALTPPLFFASLPSPPQPQQVGGIFILEEKND